MSDASNAKKGFLGGLSEKLEGVNLRQNGIFLALLGLIIFFAATTPNAASITPTNWSNLVVQNGYILVLAIGMVMIIIAGHIDLSVGSLAAFIGAVAGVDVRDQGGRGAIGAPQLMASHAIVGLEVEVAPEGGKAPWVRAICAVVVDVCHLR